MKDFAEQFYKSARWQRCRKAYISSWATVDGGLCETCRTRVGTIVHHKVTLTESNIKDAEVAFGFENQKFECWTSYNREERGGFKVNLGGDSLLQYHQESGSHHGGAYYKTACVK